MSCHAIRQALHERRGVATENLIFVSTSLATYVIDRESHQTAWSYPLVGSLSLSRNGMLYMMQGANRLLAEQRVEAMTSNPRRRSVLQPETGTS